MTSFAAESPSGVVPVLPLPDVCLLPGELLPLFIFEERYRALLAQALAGERLIALARFAPGWEDSYYGNPALQPCFGVGRIAAHTQRRDGNSDIVLRGVARVRLLECVRAMPYRLLRVEDLPEVVSDDIRLAGVSERIEELLSGMSSDPRFPARTLVPEATSLPELPGKLAGLLKYDPLTKQRLLEADDLVARLEIVLNCLRESDPLRMPGLVRDRVRPDNTNWN